MLILITAFMMVIILIKRTDNTNADDISDSFEKRTARGNSNNRVYQ